MSLSDVSAISTQTENKELEQSFTETYDLMPETPKKLEISVQTDSAEVREKETANIAIQTEGVWSMADLPTVTTIIESQNSITSMTSQNHRYM